MNKKKFICLLVASFVFFAPIQGHAFTGAAQIPYLIRLVMENVKRYKQLKMMIDQTKQHKKFLENLNAGIENAIGLLESLPIEDEGLLKELKEFKKSYETITEIYGQIPKSKESAMMMLHDQTVAESIRMINDFKKFAKEQEANTESLQIQSQTASPKGAQRMAVQSNAMVMKGLTQLIRLESQKLKMQSETLALKNKLEKDSVHSYQKVNQDMSKAFGNLRPSSRMPRL